MDRTTTFTVNGKTYSIEFPTVSQFMNIEAQRMALSGGNYNKMLMSSAKTTIVALDLIDMAATISVLVPEFNKDLKTGSVLDLDLADSVELLKQYKEQVESWIDSWMDLFKGVSLSIGDKKD